MNKRKTIKSQLTPDFEATRGMRLGAVLAALTKTYRALENRSLPYDPARDMIMLRQEVVSGLWAQCQRETLELMPLIRYAREWWRVRSLCIRTQLTVTLYDLLDQRFFPERKKKKATTHR